MKTNMVEIWVPLVPLRGLVVYPKLLAHLDIGREQSLAAVQYAMDHNRDIVLVAQINEDVEKPIQSDLYSVGVIVKVKQLLRLPGGMARALIEGIGRVEIKNTSNTGEYMQTTIADLQEININERENEAYRRVALDRFITWLEVVKNNQEDLLQRAQQMEIPGVLADFIASKLPLKTVAKQEILAMTDVTERLQQICQLLSVELEIADMEVKLNETVRSQMEKAQREYYLREKVKVIQKELGDKTDLVAEATELREKAKGLNLPPDVEAQIAKEIDRLESMPAMMAESAVIRNYVDWLLALPWNKESEDSKDLQHAQRILDADHFGLEKVKDRIVEHLAVKQLTNSLKGPILCLVGPPGVGKTSLARSVARAMNREFVRVSLGGIRDEAEIRGHRRTYIGAMPGRIIQGIKSAKTKNPVFLLDEIDKMSADLRGDPAAALLETLDPEQNNTFSDHYIELPFDLSKVLWITTANVLGNIPRPLLDRMEIIQLDGYTEEEKLEIAKRYLVPKQLQANGVTLKQIKFSNTIIQHIIRDYTRESGVRSLEKTIGSLCRKIGKSIVLQEIPLKKLGIRNLAEFLGPVKYLPTKLESLDQIGLVTGMAWTQVGGEVLPTEVVTMKGKGHLQLTGQLGNVMKESAQAGVTYIRNHAEQLGLEEDFYDKLDVHIHLPEGAIPKDGPSAGITMATALASALTGQAVYHDLAMTGEITLRGTVLPVGGIKEKVLAAHRAGIKKILLPLENKRDMDEIPESVKMDVQFVFVAHMDEVLEQALVKS